MELEHHEQPATAPTFPKVLRLIAEQMGGLHVAKIVVYRQCWVPFAVMRRAYYGEPIEAEHAETLAQFCRAWRNPETAKLIERYRWPSPTEYLLPRSVPRRRAEQQSAS